MYKYIYTTLITLEVKRLQWNGLIFSITELLPNTLVLY